MSLKDIDREACAGRILHGKADRVRLTDVAAQSFAAIDLWIDKREELGLERRSHFFCTLQGKSVDSSDVRHLMKRLATKADISISSLICCSVSRGTLMPTNDVISHRKCDGSRPSG